MHSNSIGRWFGGQVIEQNKMQGKPYAYIISRKPIEKLFNYINTLTNEYLQCWQTSQQAAFSKRAVATQTLS